MLAEPPVLGPLLNVNGAAEYLATSESHIRRLVFERRITYVKVRGKVRFIQADLDDFIARARRPAER